MMKVWVATIPDESGNGYFNDFRGVYVSQEAAESAFREAAEEFDQPDLLDRVEIYEVKVLGS